RVARMAERARALDLPVIYAHLVGGQDEVVFDGASFALDAQGSLVGRAPGFQEDLFMLQAERAPGRLVLAAQIVHERSPEADLWDALVLGVRDYVGKNKFPGVLLGLSGGVDSALVLAVAVDALGRDRVRAVMLPSPYTRPISLEDARTMAGTLGVRYDEVPIEPVFGAFLEALASEFRDLPPDAAEE